MLNEWLIAFRLRIKALFKRRQLDRDLEDELSFHLAMSEAKQAESGTLADEAHYAARRQFGNQTLLKEATRDMWTFVWLESVWEDLRYAGRGFRRNPAFTAVAVITLALGIGANTAIFSLLDAVMLRSLPVRAPSQLVLFRWKAHHAPRASGYSSFGDCPGGNGGVNPSGCSFPLPVFEEIRSRTKAFSGVTAFAGPAQLDLSGNGPARMASGELVSGDYFSTLGVNAAIGRTLGPGDDSPGASPAIVLSYAYWQSAFGGERSTIGRTILLNNVAFTIVGVAEPSFTNLSPGNTQDFWLPVAMLPRVNIGWGRNMKGLSNWWLVILGRLKPGVSREQAQGAASLIFRNEMLHGAKPLSKSQDDPAITLVPAHEGLTGSRSDFSAPLYTLMFAVGFVLLIACANVAGLLLAHAAVRQKEMAVRLAVGAGRTRIFRQLLTESLMLSLAGGALGVLFAYWGVHAITALMSNNSNPFPFVIAPDWRVLAFTISVSLLTGILFGLAPAFRSTRLDLTPALKENASTFPGGAAHARRLQLGNMLVVAQVGLSIVMLIGAGLLVRTLENLRSINPGFDTRNILLFGIDPTLMGYKDARIGTLYRDLRDRLSALPGIISVGFSSDALLSGGLWTEDVHIEGQPEKSTADVDMLAAGPGFFRTLRIPLLEGRTFTSEDFEQAAEAAAAIRKAREEAKDARAPLLAAATPPAVGPPIPVLVNRTFVRRYFANQDPLGERITKGHSEGSSGGSAVSKPKSPSWQITGVVGDTKYNNLRRKIHPTVYLPATGGGEHFELRTASNPAALIPAVRDAANRLDNNLPLFDVHTQSEKIGELVAQERIIARLSSFFGVLALLLACVGLYGLLAYEVARRTREIGIRMALGAERNDVLKLVLGQGLRLTLIGVVAGIIVALALTRFLSSLLYGVKSTDPLTLIVAALVMSGVAALASYIPARRATRVDPLVALRHE